MSASGPPPDSASWAHGRTRGPGLASGESPKAAGGLVGRGEELGRVRALLEAARGGLTGALVVQGEAGIGKTTLLAAAEELADGLTCLWARGVESEAALGHAALLELLTPVQDRLADLPAAQAEALAAALGWGPAGAPGDRYLVAAATLSLLAAAAERAPVLVLVDDLHWVDRESAAALLFSARRLHRDAVAFLFAVRTGSASAVPLGGLSVLPLAGLAPAEAAGLLPARLADPVAARLVEGTRGNPLALSEVARRLTPAQLVGAAPLPDPLPVGARLELVYQPVLAGLSAPAWRAVLLCAAGPEGAAAGLVSALDQDGLDAGAALDEAEERGILVRDGGSVAFRHPLLRSAAWRLATRAQRRAAHLALAGALPGEAARTARNWHLAEAAAGPDDVLAGELVAVAEEDRTRRGFAAAAAALERAALLTTDPGLAAERLAAAVGDAFLAGDIERTRALAARVLEGPAGRAARAQVLYTLGVLEQYAGSVPRAAELLAAAAELADGPQRVWALAELGNTRFRLNDLAGVGEIADRLAEAADPGDPGQRALAAFARGVTLTVAGDPAAARPLLTDVLELLQSPPLRDDPRYLINLAVAAGFLGDLRGLVAPFEQRLAETRERGALGVLVPGLALMASGRAWLGDHTGAFADAGEAAELGEQLGYATDTAVAVEMLAWQSAARGLHDDARRALERARALTDRAGTTSVAAHQAITAAFCALCRGDLAEAAALLEARIAADGGIGSLGEPLGVAPTLVEAYVGLGRAADAAALAGRYADVTAQSPPAATAALVARCRGLTAADEGAAAEAFEAALAAHAQAPDAFEAARTRLLYGARLRRAGRRVAAREQLRVALDAFAAMDLTAWVQRAADELGATGATARPRRPLASEPLTSQETRVALLVARGLSNREVAAALFLSPKTIEHHLGSVFRKRGFRSRTELARAFATAAAEGG
jgi:DNA-binding CsgD family transcriptional regulator/tetratricopeptide (TPR) repeat protein